MKNQNGKQRFSKSVVWLVSGFAFCCCCNKIAGCCHSDTARCQMPDVVALSFYPSTQEAELVDLWVIGQPGLRSETLFNSSQTLTQAAWGFFGSQFHHCRSLRDLVTWSPWWSREGGRGALLCCSAPSLHFDHAGSRPGNGTSYGQIGS